jgi:cytidine deaminase
MQSTTFDGLSLTQQNALFEAEEAYQHSYNPYSHFFVGACLYTTEGLLIAGTNCENAAYGSTICAERAALLRANTMGVIGRLEGVAIIARGSTFDSEEPTAPCGSCRQMIYEFAQVCGRDLVVVLSNTKKSKIIVTTIGELLPMAFGPIDLGVDVKRFVS